jgi:hypothetical protein
MCLAVGQCSLGQIKKLLVRYLALIECVCIPILIVNHLTLLIGNTLS